MKHSLYKDVFKSSESTILTVSREFELKTQKDMESQRKPNKLSPGKQSHLRSKIAQLEAELQEMKKLLVKGTVENPNDADDFNQIPNLQSGKQIQNQLAENSEKRCRVKESLKKRNLKMRLNRKQKKKFLTSSAKQELIKDRIFKNNGKKVDDNSLIFTSDNQTSTNRLIKSSIPCLKKSLLTDRNTSSADVLQNSSEIVQSSNQEYFDRSGTQQLPSLIGKNKKKKLRWEKHKALVKSLKNSFENYEHNDRNCNVEVPAESRNSKKRCKKKGKKLEASSNQFNNAFKYKGNSVWEKTRGNLSSLKSLHDRGMRKPDIKHISFKRSKNSNNHLNNKNGNLLSLQCPSTSTAHSQKDCVTALNRNISGEANSDQKFLKKIDGKKRNIKKKKWKDSLKKTNGGGEFFFHYSESSSSKLLKDKVLKNHCDPSQTCIASLNENFLEEAKTSQACEENVIRKKKRNKKRKRDELENMETNQEFSFCDSSSNISKLSVNEKHTDQLNFHNITHCDKNIPGEITVQYFEKNLKNRKRKIQFKEDHEGIESDKEFSYSDSLAFSHRLPARRTHINQVEFPSDCVPCLDETIPEKANDNQIFKKKIKKKKGIKGVKQDKNPEKIDNIEEISYCDSLNISPKLPVDRTHMDQTVSPIDHITCLDETISKENSRKIFKEKRKKKKCIKDVKQDENPEKISDSGEISYCDSLANSPNLPAETAHMDRIESPIDCIPCLDETIPEDANANHIFKKKIKKKKGVKKLKQVENPQKIGDDEEISYCDPLDISPKLPTYRMHVDQTESHIEHIPLLDAAISEEANASLIFKKKVKKIKAIKELKQDKDPVKIDDGENFSFCDLDVSPNLSVNRVHMNQTKSPIDSIPCLDKTIPEEANASQIFKKKMKKKKVIKRVKQDEYLERTGNGKELSLSDSLPISPILPGERIFMNQAESSIDGIPCLDEAMPEETNASQIFKKKRKRKKFIKEVKQDENIEKISDGQELSYSEFLTISPIDCIPCLDATIPEETSANQIFKEKMRTKKGIKELKLKPDENPEEIGDGEEFSYNVSLDISSKLHVNGTHMDEKESSVDCITCPDKTISEKANASQIFKKKIKKKKGITKEKHEENAEKLGDDEEFSASNSLKLSPEESYENHFDNCDIVFSQIVQYEENTDLACEKKLNENERKTKRELGKGSEKINSSEDFPFCNMPSFPTKPSTTYTKQMISFMDKTKQNFPVFGQDVLFGPSHAEVSDQCVFNLQLNADKDISVCETASQEVICSGSDDIFKSSAESSDSKSLRNTLENSSNENIFLESNSEKTNVDKLDIHVSKCLLNEDSKSKLIISPQIYSSEDFSDLANNLLENGDGSFSVLPSDINKSCLLSMETDKKEISSQNNSLKSQISDHIKFLLSDQNEISLNESKSIPNILDKETMEISNCGRKFQEIGSVIMKTDCESLGISSSSKKSIPEKNLSDDDDCQISKLCSAETSISSKSISLYKRNHHLTNFNESEVTGTFENHLQDDINHKSVEMRENNESLNFSKKKVDSMTCEQKSFLDKNANKQLSIIKKTDVILDNKNVIAVKVSLVTQKETDEKFETSVNINSKVVESEISKINETLLISNECDQVNKNGNELNILDKKKLMPEILSTADFKPSQNCLKILESASTSHHLSSVIKQQKMVPNYTDKKIDLNMKSSQMFQDDKSPEPISDQFPVVKDSLLFKSHQDFDSTSSAANVAITIDDQNGSVDLLDDHVPNVTENLSSIDNLKIVDVQDINKCFSPLVKESLILNSIEAENATSASDGFATYINSSLKDHSKSKSLSNNKTSMQVKHNLIGLHNDKVSNNVKESLFSLNKSDVTEEKNSLSMPNVDVFLCSESGNVSDSQWFPMDSHSFESSQERRSITSSSSDNTKMKEDEHDSDDLFDDNFCEENSEFKNEGKLKIASKYVDNSMPILLRENLDSSFPHTPQNVGSEMLQYPGTNFKLSVHSKSFTKHFPSNENVECPQDFSTTNEDQLINVTNPSGCHAKKTSSPEDGINFSSVSYLNLPVAKENSLNCIKKIQNSTATFTENTEKVKVKSQFEENVNKLEPVVSSESVLEKHVTLHFNNTSKNDKYVSSPLVNCVSDEKNTCLDSNDTPLKSSKLVSDCLNPNKALRDLFIKSSCAHLPFNSNQDLCQKDQDMDLTATSKSLDFCSIKLDKNLSKSKENLKNSGEKTVELKSLSYSDSDATQCKDSKTHEIKSCLNLLDITENGSSKNNLNFSNDECGLFNTNITNNRENMPGNVEETSSTKEIFNELAYAYPGTENLFSNFGKNIKLIDNGFLCKRKNKDVLETFLDVEANASLPNDNFVDVSPNHLICDDHHSDKPNDMSLSLISNHKSFNFNNRSVTEDDKLHPLKNNILEFLNLKNCKSAEGEEFNLSERSLALLRSCKDLKVIIKDYFSSDFKTKRNTFLSSNSTIHNSSGSLECNEDSSSSIFLDEKNMELKSIFQNSPITQKSFQKSSLTRLIGLHLFEKPKIQKIPGNSPKNDSVTFREEDLLVDSCQNNPECQEDNVVIEDNMKINSFDDNSQSLGIQNMQSLKNEHFKTFTENDTFILSGDDSSIVYFQNNQEFNEDEIAIENDDTQSLCSIKSLEENVLKKFAENNYSTYKENSLGKDLSMDSLNNNKKGKLPISIPQINNLNDDSEYLSIQNFQEDYVENDSFISNVNLPSKDASMSSFRNHQDCDDIFFENNSQVKNLNANFPFHEIQNLQSMKNSVCSKSPLSKRSLILLQKCKNLKIIVEDYFSSKSGINQNICDTSLDSPFDKTKLFPEHFQSDTTNCNCIINEGDSDIQSSHGTNDLKNDCGFSCSKVNHNNQDVLPSIINIDNCKTEGLKGKNVFVERKMNLAYNNNSITDSESHSQRIETQLSKQFATKMYPQTLKKNKLSDKINDSKEYLSNETATTNHNKNNSSLIHDLSNKCKKVKVVLKKFPISKNNMVQNESSVEDLTNICKNSKVVLEKYPVHKNNEGQNENSYYDLVSKCKGLRVMIEKISLDKNIEQDESTFHDLSRECKNMKMSLEKSPTNEKQNEILFQDSSSPCKNLKVAPEKCTIDESKKNKSSFHDLLSKCKNLKVVLEKLPKTQCSEERGKSFPNQSIVIHQHVEKILYKQNLKSDEQLNPKNCETELEKKTFVSFMHEPDTSNNVKLALKQSEKNFEENSCSESSVSIQCNNLDNSMQLSSFSNLGYSSDICCYTPKPLKHLTKNIKSDLIHKKKLISQNTKMSSHSADMKSRRRLTKRAKRKKNVVTITLDSSDDECHVSDKIDADSEKHFSDENNSDDEFIPLYLKRKHAHEKSPRKYPRRTTQKIKEMEDSNIMSSSNRKAVLCRKSTVPICCEKEDAEISDADKKSRKKYPKRTAHKIKETENCVTSPSNTDAILCRELTSSKPCKKSNVNVSSADEKLSKKYPMRTNQKIKETEDSIKNILSNINAVIRRELINSKSCEKQDAEISGTGETLVKKYSKRSTQKVKGTEDSKTIATSDTDTVFCGESTNSKLYENNKVDIYDTRKQLLREYPNRTINKMKGTKDSSIISSSIKDGVVCGESTSSKPFEKEDGEIFDAYTEYDAFTKYPEKFAQEIKSTVNNNADAEPSNDIPCKKDNTGNSDMEPVSIPSTSQAKNRQYQSDDEPGSSCLRKKHQKIKKCSNAIDVLNSSLNSEKGSRYDKHSTEKDFNVSSEQTLLENNFQEFIMFSDALEKVSLFDFFPKGIARCFQILEQTIFTEHNFEISVKNLVSGLCDPAVVPKSSDIILHIVTYLSLCQNNPIVVFDKIRNISNLFPPKEKCLVSALFTIDFLYNDPEWLPALINTMHQIVLTKNNLSLLGTCSICRVLAEIYKRRQNKQGLLSLISDILKKKHKFSPMLIASIVGVWNTVFETADTSTEENLFYSTILHAAQKETDKLSYEEWNACSCILQACISAPAINNIGHILNILMSNIQEKCADDSYDKENMLTDAVIILAATEEWVWTKKELIYKYLIPAIKKYAFKERNGKMLSLFCNLYAEICSHSPRGCKPEKVLMDLFEKDVTDTEGAFIKEIAAVPLIKLLLLRDHLLPENVKKWLETNANHPKVTALTVFFHRRLMGNSNRITDTEILAY